MNTLEAEIRQNIKAQRIPDLYTDHCSALLSDLDRARQIQVEQGAEIRRLMQRETQLGDSVDALTTQNNALSEMMRGMMDAAAETNAEHERAKRERDALHKLIAGALLRLDSLSPMEALTRLLALRREYADVCAEAVKHE